MAGPFSTAEHGNAIWIVFVYFNIVTEYRITSVAKVFVVFNSDAYALRMRLRNSASFALKWYMYEFHFALQIYGTVYTMVCMLCIEHFILFSVSFLKFFSFWVLSGVSIIQLFLPFLSLAKTKKIGSFVDDF